MAIFAGCHVLLVDDILDSGGTIQPGRAHPSRTRGGQREGLACSCEKDPPHPQSRRRGDYVGFEIPDEFVVGYGFDYNDYYRNLPDIVTLKSEVIGKSK